MQVNNKRSVFRLSLWSITLYLIRIPQHVDPHRTDPDAVMASEPTLSSLAALAASGSTSREATSSGEKGESGSTKTKEQLKKHYIRALHKVIDESDIIILVLDARDPDGTRSQLVEEEVLRRESEGKKLVFVLNKIGAHRYVISKEEY